MADVVHAPFGRGPIGTEAQSWRGREVDTRLLGNARLGLLIVGAVGAWVPDAFWRHLFLTSHPLAARLRGPVISPVISLLSFVCSIGNVPLAGVLWNGGISFGGVVAFIFAGLIIIAILIICRKYYGTKMMLVILGIFYAAMVAAGYIIEFLFAGLGLVPATRATKVTADGISWNYATILNIIFLLLAGALLGRFFRSGGGHAEDDGRQPRPGGAPRACRQPIRPGSGRRQRLSRWPGCCDAATVSAFAEDLAAHDGDPGKITRASSGMSAAFIAGSAAACRTRR